MSFAVKAPAFKKSSALLFCAFATFNLTACSNAVEVECGGDATIAAFEEMLQKSLEDSVRSQLDSEGSIDGYDSSKLRSGTRQIKVSLQDVRTVKDDPDSSRKFCSARVELKLPNNVIEAANSARSLAELSDVKKLAHQHRIERSGDKYGRELEYSIQPTDDGTKIIAETDEDSSLFSFLAELFASYLLSEEVQNRAIEADKLAADEAREAKLAEEEADAALNESALANLNEAKVENRMAVQRINAVWSAIPKGTKGRLLELQRAWIRKTTAQCKVEAAGTSEISAEREATRLRCETRSQLQRARQLEQFASYGEDYGDDAASEASDAAARAGEAAARAAEAAAEGY
jgi:uncharacterized protein YecT (DUF1311 family)